MNGDEKNLINMSEYRGGRVVVTSNNSKRTITHIRKTVFVPHHNSKTSGTSKCLPYSKYEEELIICIATTYFGNYVLFRPNDVKVYQNSKVTSTPIM